MKRNEIIATVGHFDDLAKDFIQAWHDAEAGKRSTKLPKHKLYFENAETLFKSLSPARTALLCELHQSGKISIRRLAKQLGRDYKNIHRDVQLLMQVGLICRDTDEQQDIFMPWGSIITEIPMAKKTERSGQRPRFRP